MRAFQGSSAFSFTVKYYFTINTEQASNNLTGFQSSGLMLVLCLILLESVLSASDFLRFYTLSQAQRLKKFSAEGKCNLEAMCAIMSEEKKGEPDRVTLTGDKIKKYFPKNYTPQQMEATIIKLLEGWHKKRTQQQER